MPATVQRWYHSTQQQDFSAASEVDIRKVVDAAPGAASNTICTHPNAAGTTDITLDPYTNSSTQSDIRANCGWCWNRLGAVNTDGGLIVPAIDYNGAYVADASEYDITGSVRLAWRLAADDWTPTAASIIGGKWRTTPVSGRSYVVELQTDGKIAGAFSTDGGSGVIAGLSSVTLPSVGAVNGTQMWVRADIFSNTGSNSEFKFYYSTDDTDDYDAVTWTQLGTTQLSTTGTIFSAGQPLFLAGSGTAPLAGTYRAVVVENIATSTRVVDAEFNTFGYTFVEGLGDTVNILSEGMASRANEKRIIPAGTWTFVTFVSIPAAGTATGTLTVSNIYQLYRVSSSGARSTIGSPFSSNTVASALAAGANSGALTATTNPGLITLEANESIHVGIISHMVQTAGLAGATVSGVATYRVGTAAEYIEVAAPGIRTSYLRSTDLVGDGVVTREGLGITRAFSLVGDGVVTSSKLVAATIEADLVGDGVPTSTKLVTAAKSADLVGDGIVTSSKLVAATIETDLVGDGEVTSSKLVAAAKSFDMVGDGVPDSSKLVTAAKSADLVGDGTVTFAKVTQAVRSFDLVGEGIVTGRIEMPIDEVPDGSCPPCPPGSAPDLIFDTDGNAYVLAAEPDLFEAV